MTNSVEQSEIWDNIFANDELNNLETLLEGNKWYSVSHSPYLEEVLSRITSDSVIHESGCGFGQWLIFLQKKGYKNLYGIDFAGNTIKCVQKSYPSINFKCGNIISTDYPDEAFNVILSWSVVDHLNKTDLLDTLNDYSRILIKGGLLYISVPFKNLFYYSPMLALVKTIFNNGKFRKLIGLKEIRGNFIQYFFSSNELRDLLETHGFEIVKEVFSGHEIGLTRHINGHFLNKTRIFHKNKTGEWNGLNRVGSFICKALMIFSKKASADEILFIVCKK